ncbi:MAG: dihydroneopterin aldolase [OM182 bacterium]|jgi:dihydroneopterin aldolase|nr:MAG: dihydroneopterin aldolase [OM182 bacterium]|tara:strand:+ start:38 stop:415 length:378 start_codon:yes stop_codon:yes gene_type:complete
MSIDSARQDKVLIRELKVEAILGILPQERVTPQPVLINITVFTDTRRAARSKDIVDAVNYAALADAATKLTIDGKYLLIETLVEDLAALSLSLAHVEGVSVRVEKPQAVPAAGAVGVEIYRTNKS